MITCSHTGSTNTLGHSKFHFGSHVRSRTSDGWPSCYRAHRSILAGTPSNFQGTMPTVLGPHPVLWPTQRSRDVLQVAGLRPAFIKQGQRLVLRPLQQVHRIYRECCRLASRRTNRVRTVPVAHRAPSERSGSTGAPRHVSRMAWRVRSMVTTDQGQGCFENDSISYCWFGCTDRFGSIDSGGYRFGYFLGNLGDRLIRFASFCS